MPAQHLDRKAQAFAIEIPAKRRLLDIGQELPGGQNTSSFVEDADQCLVEGHDRRRPRPDDRLKGQLRTALRQRTRDHRRDVPIPAGDGGLKRIEGLEGRGIKFHGHVELEIGCIDTAPHRLMLCKASDFEKN